MSTDEARRRLNASGLNRLREIKAPGAWRILLAQFANLVVALLAAAALVAFAFGEWLDGFAIAAVLAINSAIGFATEYRAVRSMEALRSLGSVRSKVRRDGRDLEVPATQLVTGDIVLIEAGDVVTADLRLLSASKVEADESTLTGESVPVGKSPAPVPAASPLPDRSSMLFKGTALTRGTAESVVVATGMQTELGRIARLVQDAEKGATPLEKRLSALGRRLIVVTVVIAAATTALGIAAGEPLFLMIETGIALAIAAVPEGLPIVATMALARGMWRMARRHALINRLSAVETLGATTVIFTDKTGTLTENRMAVRRVALDGTVIDVEADDERLRTTPGLRAAIEAGVLCNNASLGAARGASGIGDPMEVALLELGASAGIARAELLEPLPEVREEAFDTASMMMATFHRERSGYRVAVKGAPEQVLAASTTVLDEEGHERAMAAADREAWTQAQHALAGQGLRVLAVAQRSVPADSGVDDVFPYEQLTLLALLGLADPPRPEVPAALAACRRAGLRVVMVTGDHADTALSIARAVELVGPDDPAQVVLGPELERLDELPPSERSALLAATIYARVTPEQKLGLIAAYQDMQHVVAMTGDGVNDAPALRKSDIGIAMGGRGTQVAREAADMVLTDDAFGSIVAAIEQGRTLFGNIRKFVFYLLSCNVGEVLVVSIAAAIRVPLPLLPLQILFLNLVTDVFPALALSFGEGDARVLERPPRDPRAPIVSRRDWLAIGGFGLVISASVLGAMLLATGQLDYSRERAVTVSFLTLALAQLWHVFNVRNEDSGLVRNEVTRNPWVWSALVLCILLVLASVYLPGLRTVLRTSAPTWRGWLLVMGMSLVPLIVGQAWLTWRQRVGTRSPDAPARGRARPCPR